MSYDALASRSGLTRGTLINLGTGRYRGDLRTWLLLAKAWDVPLDDLLAPVWENGKQ
ncbi:helix-turn-helix transcriptional regulator [Yimella sp. cx-51]|nr:helix-turn-helix transcriptional regulator [Yimella sp. cx-51]MBC9957695.1 helix-turn-helix transcriptional regulator [Yimella sp. cx-51]QTH39590.1 helix-turn-helix transcriptional regulator [Yimella sp. cx-51]